MCRNRPTFCTKPGPCLVFTWIFSSTHVEAGIQLVKSRVLRRKGAGFCAKQRLQRAGKNNLKIWVRQYRLGGFFWLLKHRWTKSTKFSKYKKKINLCRIRAWFCTKPPSHSHRSEPFEFNLFGFNVFGKRFCAECGRDSAQNVLFFSGEWFSESHSAQNRFWIFHTNFVQLMFNFQFPTEDATIAKVPYALFCIFSFGLPAVSRQVPTQVAKAWVSQTWFLGPIMMRAPNHAEKYAVLKRIASLVQQEMMDKPVSSSSLGAISRCILRIEPQVERLSVICQG